MAPGKIAWIGVPGLLFGYPCILDDIGEHRGSVCEGEESSLIELSPQRTLAGWWERVREDGSKVSTGSWLYFYIDRDFRPRVLTSFTPEEFNEHPRGAAGATFGCANYQDHPLVVGGSNRTPVRSRTTLTQASCADAGSRYRVPTDRITSLLNLRRGTGRMCFDYQSADARGAQYKDDAHGASSETFCFAYHPDKERVEIAHGEDAGNLTSRFYQRRGTATPDPEEESTQSSPPSSSTADDVSTGAGQ